MKSGAACPRALSCAAPQCILAPLRLPIRWDYSPHSQGDTTTFNLTRRRLPAQAPTAKCRAGGAYTLFESGIYCVRTRSGTPAAEAGQLGLQFLHPFQRLLPGGILGIGPTRFRIGPLRLCFRPLRLRISSPRFSFGL